MNKLSLSILIVLLLCSASATPQESYVFTVSKKMNSKNLGFVLPHEHLMSNFGAEPQQVAKYDEVQLVAQVVPYLKKLKTLGVQTIFDCTTAYFGRNARLLKRLSDASGVQIVTNTGFYGAAEDRYVPPVAYSATAEEIAAIWTSEFEKGIDGTNIRPGFMKLAFDTGPPSKIDLKLFEAGVITHMKTGLTMAVHTGDNPEAINEQLKLLAKYRVHPSTLIWVHANKVEQEDELFDKAKKGVWISLDGIKPSNINAYTARIQAFKEAKLLDKVLLSHDGNSFPRGGKIREYQALPELLIPALIAIGFSKEEINQLTIENPKRAFSIQKRML